MPNPDGEPTPVGHHPQHFTRRGLTARLARCGLLGVLAASACVSRKVDAPVTLAPRDEATLGELVARVNERQTLETLTAAGDLQFETHEAAAAGVARRFRKTDGRILIARPNRLRLQIQVPLLKTSLAEMASDGDHFQLLVYPAEHRAFIEGSASRDYSQEAARLAEDPELARVGPLVNVRPQHLVEAFLLTPVELADPFTVAVVAEERRVESDDRPGARSKRQVVRTYQVLHVIEREPEPRLRAKFWFDRTEPGLPLTAYHVYGRDGRLTADIGFSQYRAKLGEVSSLPTVIRVDRPKDAYTLTLTLRPDSLEVNRPLPDTAFALEIPVEWGDSVRKIHLDEKSR